MDIIGIAKSHHTKSIATGKPSSEKEWKLSDSLREKITEYAKEDAAQNIYMGNKFLALRKSESRLQRTDLLFNCHHRRARSVKGKVP